MTVSLHDVRRALQGQPSPAPHRDRTAAVAAVLTPDLDLVFMRRAEFPGDPWSGHLSFPGGRVEPTDASPLHAAIRETDEELSLALEPGWLIGELDPLPTVSGLPPMVIHSFVFAIDHEPHPRPNDEAESVHRISLDDLLRGRGRGRMFHPYRGQRLELPRVDFDGVRLWGLTLRIVDDLLHRLDGRGTGLARPSEG